MVKYFENLIFELHVLYVLKNTYQISYESYIIYYLINKIIFIYNFRLQELEI